MTVDLSRDVTGLRNRQVHLQYSSIALARARRIPSSRPAQALTRLANRCWNSSPGPIGQIYARFLLFPTTNLCTCPPGDLVGDLTHGGRLSCCAAIRLNKQIILTRTNSHMSRVVPAKGLSPGANHAIWSSQRKGTCIIVSSNKSSHKIRGMNADSTRLHAPYGSD